MGDKTETEDEIDAREHEAQLLIEKACKLMGLTPLHTYCIYAYASGMYQAQACQEQLAEVASKSDEPVELMWYEVVHHIPKTIVQLCGDHSLTFEPGWYFWLKDGITRAGPYDDEASAKQIFADYNEGLFS